MTENRHKRPRDTNQLAKLIVDIATGDVEDVDTNQKAKDPTAAAAGKKGGERGGVARARILPPERRTEIAKAAAISRWGKKRGDRS